jgi:hypothetical protein
MKQIRSVFEVVARARLEAEALRDIHPTDGKLLLPGKTAIQQFGQKWQGKIPNDSAFAIVRQTDPRLIRVNPKESP